MTDLTEQLKKGELPEGFYYVRCAWSDEVEIRYVHNGVDDWQEIIAEVPSYEEYLSLTYAKEEDEGIIAEYEDENKQLKELLKECKDYLPEFEMPMGILAKIDEVLDDRH
jgi:hypothetical protein